MHRLTDPSATRLRRYSWVFVPGLLVVLLSLFVSMFSDVGSRAHAATQSSLNHTHETEFIHRRPDGYSANGFVHSIGQTANLSRIGRSNAKQPALMLTRTNSPDTVTRGKHGIAYVLSVSNGHFAGPVSAGNTIIVSNVIPAGVTGLKTQAKKSDWKVKLGSKTGPTILTATYVGPYPVLAGATLSPITVQGLSGRSAGHHLFLPAVVRLLHTNNPKKGSATTLQQQSAHIFTVKGGTTPTPKGTPPKGAPSGKSPSGGAAPSGVTPSGIAPQVVPTYQPGQTVVYTLAITNDSAAGPVLPGDSITVTDSIPTGLTGITASATTPSDWTVSVGGSVSPTTLTATYTGSYPVAAGATLSPITITGTLASTAIPNVTNTAVVVTPNDSNTSNNSGTNTFNVVPLPDLTITNPTPVGTYEVGKPVTYTLTGSDVSTAGPVLAGDAITITDTIPDGLTGITATGSSSNWNIVLSATSGASTMTATYIGSYPVTPGTALPPITITGTLTSAAPPNLANTATISTPKDSNSANDTAANTIPVAPQPDLTLTKTTPIGTTYQVGLPATYTITVSNGSSAGPVLTGDSIVITDSIPAGFSGLTAVANTPADWTVSLAGTTSPTTMTATYTGSYPVASGATLSSITLSGILTGTSTPQLTNTATVTTPNDGNTDNNSGSSTIPVLAIPDLTITNPTPTTPTGTTFEVGKPVTYTLTGSDLSTAGPVIAGDSITITDTIPAGLTGITASASSSDWTLALSATSGAATLTATYKGSYPVNPGVTLSPITITGTLTTAAITTLANSATISTPKDIDSANDTASNSITVVPQPDLSLTKTIPAAGSLQVGHSVTYSLVASNGSSAGPVLTGDSITITDTIPNGFSGLTVSATTPADWTVSVAATTSPTTMTATYKGSYPVAPGATLSGISLTGTLTSAANPQVINSATVSTPNDSNAANNTASITSPVLLAPDLSLSKTVALAPSSSVRGLAEAKPKARTFRAAIGVKSRNSGTSKTTMIAGRARLSLSSSEDMLPAYQGGQQVTYKLTISNSRRAGPVLKGDPILLVDKIPAGLTQLNASADKTYWVTKLNATTSPTTLIATYVGPYPVLAGARLPAVTLNGILTGAASRLTNTAQVKTPADTSTIGNNGHTRHTGTTSIKVIPAPDMAIMKTNFGGHAFYPGQMVQYELRVYSTHASGPVNASVPIRVTDMLPAGAYQVKAYGTNWSIAIKHIAKGTMVVATYTGHYPFVAGTWLPRIIVDARFRGHSRSSRVNIAEVTVPYDSNPRNNISRDTIVLHTPALPPTGSDPNA